MTIDPDVKGIAARFGLDAKLVQAVVNAEGGGTAIIRAVQCSLPSVQTREKAIDVVCRSAVHAMSDFITADDSRRDFVEFWAERWAPQGVANDPTHLNSNWPGNVLKLWSRA